MVACPFLPFPGSSSPQTPKTMLGPRAARSESTPMAVGARGGGAPSGKGPTKIHRAAAYICGQMGEFVVKSGLCERALVQLPDTLGVALFVVTYGGGAGRPLGGRYHQRGYGSLRLSAGCQGTAAGPSRAQVPGDSSRQPFQVRTIVISTQHAKPLKTTPCRKIAGYTGPHATAPSQQVMDKMVGEEVMEEALVEFTLRAACPLLPLSLASRTSTSTRPGSSSSVAP